VSSLETLICVALIGVSAFMSGSEVALFSLSRFQLRSLKERFRSQHRKIKALLGDPGGLLITILMVNETVNIALSAIIAGTISQWEITVPFFPGLPHWAVDTVLGILITTPLVLFFGEITPKVFAARANQLVATVAATPLSAIYEGARPLRIFLRRYLAFLSQFAGSGGKDLLHSEKSLTESEFLMMVEEGHKEGAIHQTEMDLIRNVFDLDDTPVSDVMTPLAQVQSLQVSTTLKGALATMRSHRFSRIPITSQDKRQVVGVLYSKDLLKARLEPELLTLPISSIMRKPLLVPPTMRLNGLFRKFKQQKLHMAVVQGMQGDAIGVVTMADILEALFEDILEEDQE
jgi:putative hemolysin